MPAGIPHACLANKAGPDAASQHARNVKLVCPLRENDPATAFGIKLFRASWPVHEIGVVCRLDNFDLAKVARLDQLQCLTNRRIETVAGAYDNSLAIGLACINDHRCLRKRDCHRLFQQHAFTGLQRGNGMLHMQFMRCRHIDSINICIAQHRVIIGIGNAAKIIFEPFAGITPRRAGRKQGDIRMGKKRRQGQHEAPSQPDDTKPYPGPVSRLRHQVQQPLGHETHRS